MLHCFRSGAGFTCALALITASCGPGKETAARRYFDQGRQYLAAGKYRDAEIAFRRGLKKVPDQGEALIGLARAELGQADLARAVSALKRAAQVLPERTDVRVMLADVFLPAYFADPRRPSGVLDEVKSIRKYLETRVPAGYDTLRIGGYVELAEGRSSRAIELFRAADVARPMQAEVVGLLVRLYLEAGRGGEAERLARAYLAGNKTNAAIYDQLYAYYISKKRSADAEVLLKDKVEHNASVCAYRVQLAAHYSVHGNKATAEAILKFLLDHVREFPSAYFEVGDYRGRFGNWPEAIRTYEAGAAAVPAQARDYQKRIADAFVAEGNLDDAVRVLDGLLRDQPKDVAVRAARASVLLVRSKRGDIDAAIAAFRELAEEDQGNAEFQYQLGRAYVARQDLEAAHRAFREAVSRRADYLPPLMALTEVNIDVGAYKEALAHAGEILALYPGHPRALLLKAAAQVGLGILAPAEALLKQLVKQYPDFAEAHYQFALLRLAQRRFDEAERILSRFHKPSGNDPRVMRALADLHSAKGRSDLAIRLLRAELAAGTANPAALRRILAETATRAGQYDVAIETYQQMLKDPVKPADVHYRLAALYHAKGELDSAIDQLEQAQKYASGDANVLAMLGSLLDRLGRHEVARQRYRQALAIDRENTAALNNLAYNLAETGGDLEEALRLAQAAARKSPQQPSFSDTVGWIYLKKNMPELAMPIFRNLVEKHPENPTFRYHLAAALLTRGERAVAKSELLLALSKQPSKQDEAKIRTLIAQIASRQ